MQNPALPLFVHDTAYLAIPIPVALSRVTLLPWTHAEHPETPFYMPAMGPLPPCLDSALRYVHDEAPDYFHGMLIHATQYRASDDPSPARLSTLRQALRFTPLSCAPIEGTGDVHAVVFHQDTKRRVPKWVWHHLAATLLFPASTVGEAPDLVD